MTKNVRKLCSDCNPDYKTQSTPDERAEAKVWIEMGIPTAEVAEELGRDIATVNTWIRKGNWERFKWVA